MNLGSNRLLVSRIIKTILLSFSLLLKWICYFTNKRKLNSRKFSLWSESNFIHFLFHLQFAKLCKEIQGFVETFFREIIALKYWRAFFFFLISFCPKTISYGHGCSCLTRDKVLFRKLEAKMILFAPNSSPLMEVEVKLDNL